MLNYNKNNTYNKIEITHKTWKILAIMLCLLPLIAATESLYAGSRFSGERLKQSCIDYIHSVKGAEALITLNNSVADQEFDESGITARCTGSAESLVGNSNVAIEFIKNDKLVRRLEVPVRIRIFKEVPVASRDLMRGDIIGNTMFYFEKKDITTYRNDMIASGNELYGRKLSRNIPAGSVILKSSVENEKIIHRGDKVDVIVISGGVRIRTSGEALQDAAADEPVRIKREGTHLILQGRANSNGSVIIGND